MSNKKIGYNQFTRNINNIKDDIIRKNSHSIATELEKYLQNPARPLTPGQLSYCRNLLIYIEDPHSRQYLNKLMDDHANNLYKMFFPLDQPSTDTQDPASPVDIEEPLVTSFKDVPIISNPFN